MWEDLQSWLPTNSTSENPHRREALRVQGVRTGLHSALTGEEAPESAHSGGDPVYLNTALYLLKSPVEHPHQHTEDKH